MRESALARMAGVVRDYARALEGDGEGGVGARRGLPESSARGCVGSVIDLQQGVSLARALLLSFSLLSFALSRTYARDRTFRLSLLSPFH